MSCCFVFVFIAAALMGSAFPLISHAFIHKTIESGRQISLLYLSNIVGSTLGSFLIGFVVEDHWATRETSLLLLGISVAVAGILWAQSGIRHSRTLLAGSVACVALVLASGSLFDGMYERLLMEKTIRAGRTLRN